MSRVGVAQLPGISQTVRGVLIAAGRRLPGRIRASLFHFAFNCAPDEFEKFSYLYANAPSQEHTLRAIKLRGFSPKTIVDVGAYQGQWSLMAHSIWPTAKIVMVEPNLENAQFLAAAVTEVGGILHQELLGAVDGDRVKFHVMATGSSVLPERSDVPRKVEQRTLKTLTSLLDQYATIDLLKIDAQGYELAILEGASEILPRIETVLLEVALIEVNEGSPVLHEIISYMQRRNFVALDVLELHRRPTDRALLQMDILFCRDDSRLREDKEFR